MAIFWVLAVIENIYLRIGAQRARLQSAELEELRVKQAVAERAEQTKGRFLANVSHEIRTPMNGILGMSDILLSGELNGDQRHHASLLQSSAKEMISVVDDILDYSKIEAGELSLKLEPLRLDQLSRQVVDLFGATEKLKNVEMNLVIEDDVPLDIEADASRLRQVLVNLVSNAVKFTENGEVTIQFSLLDRPDSSACIRCEVSDSGIGISTAEVDELFRPFSQGDESTSRKFGGSGLGLAISKQIIEAHSGTIGAFSRTNGHQGSVFWFEIPLQLAQVKTQLPAQATEHTRAELPTKRILLAEDDLVNQFVTVKQLEGLGHQVDIANNGHEVLKALDQDSYALILMDCQMPELDGLQATRMIREKGYSQAELPIIALTANVFDGDREACFESGMNDFITKPVVREKFLAVLTKWL
jgi:signal transduction histidine kinase